MRRIFLLILTLGLIAALDVAAITAEEIIANVENNEINEEERIEGSMTISDRFGSRVKTFISYAAGADKMLLEFTNPEERGQKILRLEDEIYLYFPEAEEVIHLQGSALKESVMGSDFSYEDMTGEGDLLDQYQVTLLGEENIDGRKHYHLELKAKKRGLAYPKQEAWIDAEYWVMTRANAYSLSGRLLKEMELGDIRKVAGKYIPHYIIMRDAMKKNSSTEMRIEEIDLQADLPRNAFSLEELTW
ncbi:MAG: outer membrane lipoprotein-sorting protein [Spirochaetaceae bacterium]|nr:MAG: outer membrane lipoprotein-sorting protein [Spirochaetaceae bacterium]